MMESTARKRLLKLFKDNKVPAVPVENICWPGTPDIVYPEGWLEIKTVENCDLPKRVDSPLKLDHFTAYQRRFFQQWSTNGGRVYMVLVLGKAWMLLDGDYVWKFLGEHTPEQIRDNSLLWSHHIFDAEEFLKVIRGI